MSCDVLFLKDRLLRCKLTYIGSLSKGVSFYKPRVAFVVIHTTKTRCSLSTESYLQKPKPNQLFFPVHIYEL